MMFKYLFFFYLMFSLTEVYAGNKIRLTNIEYKEGNYDAKFIISVDGTFLEVPELVVRDQFVQVVMPKTIVWPKLDKIVEIGGTNSKLNLTAYQYDKSTVRFRAFFPENIERFKDRINLQLKKKKIIVSVFKEDLLSMTDRQEKKSVKRVLSKNEFMGKSDEEKISSLLNDFKDDSKKEVNKNIFEDQVSRKKASFKKIESENEFNIVNMIIKFGVVLSAIILAFLGVLYLFKKKMAKGSKFALFENPAGIVVLNKVSLAPKRELMLVKVQEEFLLLGVTEQSINLIKQVKNSTNIFKNSEKEVFGNNFDDQVEKQSSVEQNLKIKENINESKDQKEKENYVSQVRKKVKNLKAFQ